MLRHCQMLLSCWDMGQVEGWHWKEYQSSPVFSQAPAMSQDHCHPIRGRKGTAAAFKGGVKEKWASRHFVMKANFRTVMVEQLPTPYHLC